MFMNECRGECPSCGGDRELFWGVSDAGAHWHECKTCGHEWTAYREDPLVA